MRGEKRKGIEWMQLQRGFRAETQEVRGKNKFSKLAKKTAAQWGKGARAVIQAKHATGGDREEGKARSGEKNSTFLVAERADEERRGTGTPNRRER